LPKEKIEERGTPENGNERAKGERYQEVEEEAQEAADREEEVFQETGILAPQQGRATRWVETTIQRRLHAGAARPLHTTGRREAHPDTPPPVIFGSQISSGADLPLWLHPPR